MKPSLKHEIMQLLFPDDIKCIVCGKEIRPNRYGTCVGCSLDINDNFCLRCGRHKVGIGDYCGECSDMKLYFDEARSAVNYTGAAKDIVHRLKYGNAKYLAKVMGEYLLDVLFATDWEFDCITFVPVHTKRLKKRGFNQAELLARMLADRTDAPCIKLLEKTKYTVNQARLDRAARMENLKDTFVVSGNPPNSVMLVDDVLTTGATANECCKMLKKSGVKTVYVLTFASVPEKPLLDTQIREISVFGK